jgi:TRAP-type C4-dicarboxylate transport system permease small subunit
MGKVLDRLVNGALAAILGGMTCVVFVSVIFRYALNNPLPWTEELASLLFAWLTFVGAYAGFRSRSHISIDTLVIFLPAPARRRLARCVDGGVLLLLALFAWQGIKLAATTWSLQFPAMEISRGYLYASFPIGSLLMAIGIVQSWRQPRPEADSPEERP